MTRRLTLLASALLLITSQAFAAHHEVATVEVVQVPVYISVDGHAVTGLTKDDFELYVNGKPQTVDYFDTIDFAALPAASTSDPHQRRLYVLTFDFLFSSRFATLRAQKAAEQFIERAQPGDVFAVATYTSNRGLQFVAPFTRDRELLHRALHSLGSEKAGDPLFLTVGAGGDLGPYSGPDVNVMTSEVMLNLSIQPLRRLVEDEVLALGSLADRMAVLDGQKHVVLLSSGFDASLIDGIQASRAALNARVQSAPPIPYASATPNNAFGTPTPPTPTTPTRVFSVVRGNPQLNHDPRTSQMLQQMYSRFTASSVFLDAIDIEGLRPGQTATDNESLFTLTRDTGGTLVERENDLTGAMQELSDKQRIVYVLGFRPTGGRSTNNLRVSVRNAPSGADIRYRPSYSNQIALPATNDGLHLADILMNDLPQTGLSLRAAVTPKGPHAIVDVDIAPRELLALSDAQDVDAEALMYVYSGNAVVAFKQKRITIESARVDPSKPVRVSQEFDLPPGHYAAKVLVRFADQIGFVRSDFVVGE